MLKYFIILMLFALLTLPPFFWRKLVYANQAEALRLRAKQRERERAFYVLGLAETASREQIRQAHKQMMKKAHPDMPGGSSEIAAKINAAKDFLLN